MTRRNDSEHDTARETPSSKRTIAVDTSPSDPPRPGRAYRIRPAAGTPPVGLPRPAEPRLVAPGVRKVEPRPTLVGRLLRYLRSSDG